MSALLIGEHTNDALNPATAKALTAAIALGGDVDILIAGNGCQAAADEAAKLSGVRKVIVVEGPHLEHQVAEEVAGLIVPMMANYDALVAPATARGKNVMPRIAAMLDVMQISDITAVKSEDTFERPIYAGNAIQTVKSQDAKKIITVRTAAFASAEEGGSAQIETAEAPTPVAITTFERAEIASSGPAGTGLRQDRHFRWPRHAVRRKLRKVPGTRC